MPKTLFAPPKRGVFRSFGARSNVSLEARHVGHLSGLSAGHLRDRYLGRAVVPDATESE